MTSDERIARLERDLKHTRFGMLLVAVGAAIAIIWGRSKQPDEIVMGDMKIDRSGITIQPPEAPQVRVELSSLGLRIHGAHFSSSMQSSNLTFEGEHGTTTVTPGQVAINDSLGQSILTGSHWQAVGGDAKHTGADVSLDVQESGATVAIGTRDAGVLIDTGAKSTILSGRNGVGSWTLVAGPEPRIYVASGSTTAALTPSSKP